MRSEEVPVVHGKVSSRPSTSIESVRRSTRPRGRPGSPGTEDLSGWRTRSMSPDGPADRRDAPRALRLDEGIEENSTAVADRELKIALRRGGERTDAPGRSGKRGALLRCGRRAWTPASVRQGITEAIRATRRKGQREGGLDDADTRAADHRSRRHRGSARTRSIASPCMRRSGPRGEQPSSTVPLRRRTGTATPARRRAARRAPHRRPGTRERSKGCPRHDDGDHLERPPEPARTREPEGGQHREHEHELEDGGRGGGRRGTVVKKPANPSRMGARIQKYQRCMRT